MSKTVLYIGGFELPDRNAAAHRVVGIAKGLREIGYNVVFLNSLKIIETSGVAEKEYFGFKCYEYKRESEKDYLLSATTALSMIKRIKPDAIIAYNYPAVALNTIRKYCRSNSIKCYADTTEWYQAVGENVIYRVIKNLDTAYRMRYVQKKLDGVIAISRYLYDYYKNEVKSVIIPPTVDLTEDKWHISGEHDENIVSFVYAGVPIALKEKLNYIVREIAGISEEKKVVLNVIGVTSKQFKALYSWKDPLPEAIRFWGRIGHTDVLKMVKQADWAIILRDNNRVVKAGFPTKLVEAITCGTPVIVNRFSNIVDYLDANNSLLIENNESIHDCLKKAMHQHKLVDTSIFDYHNYILKLKELFS